ncbi:hypothetical protein MKW98_021693, partial [Papaver atlanticum]
KCTISSTNANATKAYPNIDIPVVVALKERYPYERAAANEIMCNVAATEVLLENGWNYLACTWCSKKVVGYDGDQWCSKCETKVETPISWFLLRFEIEDNTGSAVFLALGSEVQKLAIAKKAMISGFSQILNNDMDFQITLDSRRSLIML